MATARLRMRSPARAARGIGLCVATAMALSAPAQDTNPTAGRLPPAIVEFLGRAQVPLDSVGVVVKEAGAPTTLVSHNADKAMNPASVIKLVTTYAGLELLGPAYSWKTEILFAGEVRGSTLNGDLVLKGSGDPKLTVERLGQALKSLRDRGLSSIKGDLLLDRGFFEPVDHDPAKFDGEPLKAYNVGPDALMLNFKTVRFQFAPSVDGRTVSISPDVRPTQLDIINRMRLNDAPCGEWRDRIVLDVQNVTATQLRVAFTGNYPRSCGERAWSISLLDHPRFTGGVFASIWRDLGGSWNGAVKLSAAPADARPIATIESPPLSDVVRDINKFSNNVMARQLFLTLSGELAKEPASVARSTQIIREWLAKKGIPAPELVLENGSGLSRNERISAGTLAALLDAAWKSSVMPEFMSSLSLAGVDGTLRRRNRNDSVAGQAHLKTGTLTEAKAVAGYLLDQNGRRWVMVMMVNHANANSVQAAQDALLNWVYTQPSVVVTPLRLSGSPGVQGKKNPPQVAPGG